MEKAVAAVLMLFVVLPMIAADKPLVMPKARLMPMEPITGDVQAVNCPGGGSCDDSKTCCLNTSGTYGCCPHQNGNCCFDYAHCCASGYVCDGAHNQCIKAHPSISADVLEKLPFLK